MPLEPVQPAGWKPPRGYANGIKAPVDARLVFVAADDHPDAGENLLAAGDAAGVHVGMQVIDGHQRLIRGDAQRLGSDKPHKQRTGQAWRIGHGDRIQIAQLHVGAT